MDSVEPEVQRIAEGIAEGLRLAVNHVDWSALDAVIGCGIKIALSFVSGLLDPSLFYDIGKRIGNFLIGLDWVGIIGGLAEVLARAINAAVAAIKEAADILGVSVHTVRFYDDKGLIPGTKRNSINQRVFDDTELEWLFVSITLRNTGLSLAEVKNYIDLYQQGDKTVRERYQIMLEQRKQTLLEMENLKQRLALLDKKIKHYGKLLNGEEDTRDHAYMQNLIWKGKKSHEN